MSVLKVHTVVLWFPGISIKLGARFKFIRQVIDLQLPHTFIYHTYGATTPTIFLWYRVVKGSIGVLMAMMQPGFEPVDFV